ncbi:hypothetical protein ABL78_7468 [Leptomonas seymouri]|uniref:Uncharacterized protein n=1 Tax=Leptomonas seymouri TaxID=5684 RepID=A0A0N1HSB8_LEPSE|nr:hypothetical protein ABL78_7468 [Leptomonas seymouri]|eukprot:KPI83494.1 hypothetical protein ABL78_7468 [Leptomonas seymouri]
MGDPTVVLSKTLYRSLSPRFLQARLSGLLRDASSGTLTSTAGVSPACRLSLATSSFCIPEEALQLPPCSLGSEDTFGNVHIVNVVGPQPFVDELSSLLQGEVIATLCGHYHTELYQNTPSKLLCPSITLSLARLQNTQDSLCILHAPKGGTKELQRRLRRLIFRYDPFSCRLA